MNQVVKMAESEPEQGLEGIIERCVMKMGYDNVKGEQMTAILMFLKRRDVFVLILFDIQDTRGRLLLKMIVFLWQLNEQYVFFWECADDNLFLLS